MKGTLFKLPAACLILLLLAGTVYGKANLDSPPPAEKGSGIVLEPKGASGEAYYLVQLSQPPLASYRGTISGLAATNPAERGQLKLDPTHPDSLAYRDYLETVQSQLIDTAEQLLGRALTVGDTYQYAFNGLSIILTPAEAAEVAQLPGVRQLQRNFMRQPDTDNGPTWIGAPGIWDGTSTGSLPGTEGEGVIVGVIDTGINMDSPSFADVGSDGYNHTNPFGSGNYVGWCNPIHPYYDPSLICNDKLIGVYSHPDTGMNPEDDNGHGSHTSSTAAGNHVTPAVLVAPTIVLTRTISGVAPHANIIHYDACAVLACPLAVLVEFIDQAVLDGVDIINYSFSTTPADPWNDSDSLALLGAFDAGIFVATSAGNSGPGPGTIGSPANAPWVTASSASTHNRAFVSTLTNLTGGNTTPPAPIVGRSISSGYGPAPLIYAGAAPYNNPFCASFEDGLTGQIVVCDNGGGISRLEKGANVLAAGGGGMVLADHLETSGVGALSADPHVLPAVHITYASGLALKNWLATGAGHAGRITNTAVNVNPTYAGVMAAFSSRGPNLPVPGVIKPDLTNPGVTIYAAYRDPEDVNVLSGTSMSSAHTAGSAALLRALHPEWSAAEIKSVLMSTAVIAGLVKDDGVTPADPFDYGAGRVALTMAGEAGLVLDETGANMAAADPNLDGDPTTLNLASLANDACVLQCAWTRVVSSTLNTTVQWRASASEPTGAVIAVQPPLFTLAPYESQIITITANVANLPNDEWAFGHVHLTPATASGSVAALLHNNGPLVNYPGGNIDGYDVSAVQTISLGMSGLGFNNDRDEGFRVADDFTVTAPTGWNIDQFTFYGYQTGSPITSTFTALNYRVWDGLPGAPGSNIVFGDTTTNRLVSSTWSEIYRTTETGVLTVTDRPIMTNIASANFYLPPGTYWLDWQAAGSLGSGPWVPPITIQGQATTGNALVTDDGIEWNPVVDGGTNTRQGLPFRIEGTIAAPIDIAPVHFPLAVLPKPGYLPAEIEIHTRRDAGSQLVAGLITGEITNLQVSALGLSQGRITEQSLPEDPTNGDPFNNDGGTFFVNVTVPAGTAQLIAEITQTTADDLDLFVGRDDDNDGPEASEVDCTSATPAALEACHIANPTAGTYWVLVQNWAASANPPDSVRLETVALAPGNGSLTAVGPTANPVGAPFDLRVFWNEPNLDAGEVWFGQIMLGTDPGTPNNIGTIPIRLYRHEDDVSKSANNATPTIGDVITYTVQVLPNITPANLTYFLTDTLPAELTLIPGSASASAGAITEVGNSVRWTGLMPAGANTPITITYQTTVVECGNPITNSLLHTVNNPGSTAATATHPLNVTCPPNLTLVKTIGKFPGECGTATSMTFPLGNTGTWVVHCFTVTNTGGELFTAHTLSDTLLGPLALPSGGLLNLEPAAVFSYTQVHTITQFGLVQSCGVWTATGVSGNVSDTDCVTIEIVEPTGVSLTLLAGIRPVYAIPILLVSLLLLLVPAGALRLRRRRAV